MDTHTIRHREQELASVSNRNFGLIFGVFWAVVGTAPLLRHHPMRPWALALAAGFGLMALFFPKGLAWPNRLWTRLGAAINAVVSWVALLVAYVVGVLPTAMVLRMIGKDPLQRRFDRSAPSYWIPRIPRQPTGSGMENQF